MSTKAEGKLITKRDVLTGVLVSIGAVMGQAEAVMEPELTAFVSEALSATITNANVEDGDLEGYIAKGKMILRAFDAKVTLFDMATIWDAQEDIRSLKTLLLFGLRGMAAYASQARELGFSSSEVDLYFLEGLSELEATSDTNRLLADVLVLGRVNIKSMALLDKANATADGGSRSATGFRQRTVLTLADKVVTAIRSGKFCLANLDLGEIAGIPRLLGIGPCSDTYGIVLLTLLALGLRDIKLGPPPQAFISPNVLRNLFETYGLEPITTV